MSRLWLSLPLILMILLATVSLAGAQPASGLLTGSVLDRYGKPINRAAVRVSNLDDGLTVESLTDKKGTYRIDQLTPGTYEVMISLGPQGVLTRKVKLQAGETGRVDFVFSIKEHRQIDPTYRPAPPSLI
ncbi:MAG: carboxypeptidase-like regulatory domain-containing protein [Proteobacteria bacterium]|nr:carboxypeptidase-like regulatory domain-containing protein [Pseudomonadota bacterium]MBU1451181.1 carboxypeptidase-like regulatory domain-containing protein [Pseudomonadota bacterium]MBU2469453.1 carboxypeptidase-like regulatory domain-containing protein [Pseudomonadota bacterium]MBU2516114.1 carboxypeptidase-like regulatory domain-containing protein [Pseudomonadota bacterium]